MNRFKITKVLWYWLLIHSVQITVFTSCLYKKVSMNWAASHSFTSICYVAGVHWS